MQPTNPHHPQGFTLIELSIVLIIIGLLIGGVLVGRDLIEAAETRSVIKQMEEIQLATSTFRLKYNCKAGDCANATQFGLGTNGNGDGLLGCVADSSHTVFGGLTTSNGTGCLTHQAYSSVHGGAYGISRGFGEPQFYWAHLSASGLIKESITALTVGNQDISATYGSYFPKNALGKSHMVAVMWNSRLYIRSGMMGTDTSFTRPIFAWSGGFPSSLIQRLSTRFDAPINVNSTTSYPEALAQGKRFFVLGLHAHPAHGAIFYQPANAVPDASSGIAACAISDGAGGYKFNMENGGMCNFLWEIDY